MRTQKKGRPRRKLKGSEETVMTPFWILFALAAAAVLVYVLSFMYGNMFRGKVM
jgi:uncharacterized membrane protein YcfT